MSRTPLLPLVYILIFIKFDTIDREPIDPPNVSQNKDGVYQCKKHGQTSECLKFQSCVLFDIINFSLQSMFRLEEANQQVTHCCQEGRQILSSQSLFWNH